MIGFQKTRPDEVEAGRPLLEPNRSRWGDAGDAHS
jgi:hypothetical protein